VVKLQSAPQRLKAHSQSTAYGTTEVVPFPGPAEPEFPVIPDGASPVSTLILDGAEPRHHTSSSSASRYDPAWVIGVASVAMQIQEPFRLIQVSMKRSR
jgi:hypothetical protein